MNWWKKTEKKKKQQQQQQILARGAMLFEELIECCDGKSNPIKFFSADEIHKATKNLGYYENISEVSSLYLWIWYSVKNNNHGKLLIATDLRDLRNDLEEFCRDIAISSMVSGHKNFMKFIGCCLEIEKHRVMVYNGVKKHYKLNLNEQTWKSRMKIAEDIATALAYLHTAFPKPLVYRLLSPDNILLDEDGVAKLVDFSSCVSLPREGAFVVVEFPMGLYNTGLCAVSEVTDVRDFGMFMGLTLLSGEVESFSKGRINTYSLFLKFKEERGMEEIADPKMGELSEEEISQMKAFRMLSLRCIDYSGEEVLTMVEVVKELKKIQRNIFLEI